MLYAYVSTRNGGITDDSTLTVGIQVVQVFQRTQTGGLLASRRILETLAELGYEPDGDYYDCLETSADGIRFPVRLAPH